LAASSLPAIDAILPHTSVFSVCPTRCHWLLLLLSCFKATAVAYVSAVVLPDDCSLCQQLATWLHALGCGTTFGIQIACWLR